MHPAPLTPSITSIPELGQTFDYPPNTHKTVLSTLRRYTADTNPKARFNHILTESSFRVTRLPDHEGRVFLAVGSHEIPALYRTKNPPRNPVSQLQPNQSCSIPLPDPTPAGRKRARTLAYRLAKHHGFGGQIKLETRSLPDGQFVLHVTRLPDPDPTTHNSTPTPDS